MSIKSKPVVGDLHKFGSPDHVWFAVYNIPYTAKEFHRREYITSIQIEEAFLLLEILDNEFLGIINLKILYKGQAGWIALLREYRNEKFYERYDLQRIVD